MTSPEPSTTAARAPSRAGTAALAVVVLVACAVAWTVARDLVPIAREGYRALDRPGVRIADADLDPLAYFTSTRALSGARAVIPPGDSYTIVFGTTKPQFSALPGPQLILNPATVRLAFKLWLLPRAYVPLSQAQWVIAYNTPPDDAGVKAAQEVNLGPNATLIRVAGR